MDDFKELAIMLIYPDGSLEKVPINDRLLHMNYFVDLESTSGKFKEALNRCKLELIDKFGIVELITYELDYRLAKQGIIAFHNLFIYEIKKDREYADKNPPEYYISMPRELTEEQKEKMREIDEHYDMSTSYYAAPGTDKLEDISYEEALKLYSKQRQK